MNPLKKLLGLGTSKVENSAGRQHAPSFGMVSIKSMFGDLHSDEYASAFPSIRAISNEYMAVRPYAIDKNGKPVPHPVIDALYHPNQLDSSVSFSEKIAVSTLSLRKTYLLVWRRDGLTARMGGDFTRDTIAGFTFLEFPGVTRRDGRTYYNMGAQEFSDQEVLVLPGGVDPRNLYEGYSPSEAARRWAKLDDYIADFQAGFFENGAVPAGQFMITAPTPQEFNDIVDMLQERHKGAGKNGNVTYTHRPVDPASGKPADAQIEWIPFAQTNKEIDFKNLFEQTNHRIDVTYGVPGIVKGIDDAATYANAQVAEKTFAKRAVYPLLLRNYTQLTHELNRITNGLGVAVTFDYEIPTVADEEKVEAETKLIEANIIAKMTAPESGYTLDSVVDAFNLSNSYKLLKSGTGAPKIDNDQPEVDEGGEVEAAPDPTKVDGVTPVNKGAAKSKDPKVQNQLSDVDVETYEVQLSKVIRDNMSKQIEKYIDSMDTQNAEGDPEEPDTEEFTEEMMEVIVATLIAAGNIQYDEGVAMLAASGVSTEGLSSFALTEAQEQAYKTYLTDVAESYGEDTGKAIRNVLARGQTEDWDRTRLESELRNIMNTDEWRVTRLATSEINRSQDMGSIYSMKQIQDEADIKFERSLLHTGSDDPCEFCAAFIDNWQPLDEDMIRKDETITGVNGGILDYTWDTNEGHDVHANGHCVPQFRVS